MNQPDQAVIVISRPAFSLLAGARNFIVWIDGQKVGRVKQRSLAEFTVEPGEHTVAVAINWVWSLPLPVVVEAGARLELMIGTRPSWPLRLWLPMILGWLATWEIVEWLRPTMPVIDSSPMGWPVALFVVNAIIVMGYLLAVLLCCPDYWALFRLTPVARA